MATKNYILRGRLLKKIINLPIALISGILCLFIPKKIIAILPNHSIGVCIFYAENIISYIQKNNIRKEDLTVYTRSSSLDCNQTLLELYSRVLNINRSPLKFWMLNNGGIEILRIFNRSIPKFITGINYSGIIGEKVNISFEKDEINKNWKLLSKIGIKRGDKIALVSVRSNLYWNDKGYKNDSAEQIRNSSFENLDLAVKYLNSLNFKVIRVGHYQEDCNIKNYLSLNLFNKGERDVLDVFLHSIANLVICGPSGLAYLASIFSKPILIHNMIPIGEVMTISNSVVIPKKIIDKTTKETILYNQYKKYRKKIITDDYIYPKIIDFNLINFRDENLYEEFNLQTVENSPNEIYTGLLELLCFSECEDLMAGHRFDSGFFKSFKDNKLMNNFGGIFSPSFLEKHEGHNKNDRN